MDRTNRNRVLWLLVAIVSIHTLVTTAIFLATGTLPNGLMIFTLAVYALMALAAIYFILTAPHADEPAAARERVVVAEGIDEDEPIVRLQVEEPAPALAVPDEA